MSRWRSWIVPAVILGLILGVAVVGIAVSPWGAMFRSMVSVRGEHARLKVRGDVSEIGAAMAAVLQDPELAALGAIPGDDPKLPASLRDLAVEYLWLDPGRGLAKLEFGGGFYHYGYEIQSAGERGEGTYQIRCYGEAEEDNAVLGTFHYLPGEFGR